MENHAFCRVAELNLASSSCWKATLPLLWVRGEISNLVQGRFRPFLFSLKDESGTSSVRDVPAKKTQLLREPVGNGPTGRRLAVATLYEQRGDFQLTVGRCAPAGLGILYEQFERLKQLLPKRRDCSPPSANALCPPFPNASGIVTSPASRRIARCAHHPATTAAECAGGVVSHAGTRHRQRGKDRAGHPARNRRAECRRADRVPWWR